jgi:hypothetical protein
MKRRRLISLSFAGACIAGVACGYFVLHSPHFRDAMGIFCGRGHLLAIAQGEGIYEADLRRALSESRYASGIDEEDRQEEEDIKRVKSVTRVTTSQGDERLVLTRLISNLAARSLGAREKVPGARIDTELNGLRWQFPNEKTWRTALRASGLSPGSLHRRIAEDLRTRQWIIRQIAPQLDVTEDECRKFYETHLERFMQPVRFRANHLFVAAPAQTPPEMVETKRQTIESLADRLKHGEKLSELAVESEDEATKNRGGDLGFFSEFRIWPDFFAAVAKMRVGEISQPIRTRLGFHIIELTDLKPARQMSFEEVRTEIHSVLENEKRRAVLQNLAADLSRRAEFVSSRF